MPVSGPTATGRCRATSAAVGRLGDEHEELSADARHRDDRHGQRRRGGPHDPGAHELIRAQTRRRGVTGVFTSTVCVASSTDGEMNVMRSVPIACSVLVEELHRQAELEARRLLHGHVQVELEPRVVFDRREQRRRA